MKVLSENRVLVLSSLLAVVVAWVAGCAGMAEPLPTLSVAPSTLSVSTKVGSSNTVPVSVINTGTSPVTVSQIVMSGKGFALSGATTPMTLATNKSASFNVVFAPTDAGSVSGAVNIVTDAGHRPTSLPRSRRRHPAARSSLQPCFRARPPTRRLRGPRRSARSHKRACSRPR
jgi:Abnormal spindle-like microcephaly-assoc'd, ASPM-SPD-2-Hydin